MPISRQIIRICTVSATMPIPSSWTTITRVGRRISRVGRPAPAGPAGAGPDWFITLIVRQLITVLADRVLKRKISQYP